MKKYYISYSDHSDDEQRAIWVEYVLRVKLGYKTIMRKYDLNYGDNISIFIDDALKWADEVVIILTDEYMKSDNCKEEYSNAKKRFPIVFDSCVREGAFGSLYCLNLTNLEINYAGKELIQAINGDRTQRPEEEPFLPRSNNSIAMRE